MRLVISVTLADHCDALGCTIMPQKYALVRVMGMRVAIMLCFSLVDRSNGEMHDFQSL
jgi:hypothetical protein